MFLMKLLKSQAPNPYLQIDCLMQQRALESWLVLLTAMVLMI